MQHIISGARNRRRPFHSSSHTARLFLDAASREMWAQHSSKQIDWSRAHFGLTLLRIPVGP